MIGSLDLFFRSQIHENAATVVSVDRLDHNGTFDGLRGFPSIFGTFDLSTFRHRNPRRGQHHFRQLLVLSN